MRNMNYHPFNSFYNLKTNERIKEIENQIKEEKNQQVEEVKVVQMEWVMTYLYLEETLFPKNI